MFESNDGDGHYSSNVVRMKRRGSRFDDDFRGLPRVKNGSDGLEDVRFFTGKGDRVVTDADRQYPEIDMLLKELSLGNGMSLANLNCRRGFLGIAIAHMFPENTVHMMDNNLNNVEIARNNVALNSLRNAEVTGEVGAEALLTRKFSTDAVIYDAQGHLADLLVRQQLAYAKMALGMGQEMYVVTHRKAGANSHIDHLREVFGDANAQIASRGKGGYRVLHAVKKDEDVPELGDTKKAITYEVKGKTYEAKTDVGLFSRDDLDKGTRLLLESVDLTGFDSLLDVGCGWGAISLAAATENPRGHVIGADVDLRATTTAELNVRNSGLSDRVEVIPTTQVRNIDADFDMVVSNPPFHETYGILTEMFRGIRNRLVKHGELYIVVERSYVGKFSNVLTDTMGRFQEFATNNDYTVLKSTK